jgi:hypothetical protein
VGSHADYGAWIDYGTGVDASGGLAAGVESSEGLGKSQARISKGDPGQAPLQGLLLQGCGLIAARWQQNGSGVAAGQGGGQGVAGFQKSELIGLGLI